MTNNIIQNILISANYFNIFLIIIYIYGFHKMNNIYTKLHFSGSIDSFIAPIFIFIFYLSIISINNLYYNFIYLGKIFFLLILLVFSSIINTHCLSRINFENKKEIN